MSSNTQLALSGPVDVANAIYVPHGRSHYKPITKSIEDGGVVRSFAKRALKTTQKELVDMVSTKGNEKLLKIWDKKVTPNNVMRLVGKEGDYLYAIFDVDGFPEQSKKAIPFPLDISERLAKKAYAAAKEDPAKFGIKLNHPSEAVRARHIERMEALNWSSSQCTRKDKEGKDKPCTINPKDSQGWTLCPAKNVPKCSLSDMAPKTSKVGGKRSAETHVLPEFMSIAEAPIIGVKRMVVYKYGERVAVDTQNGVVTITDFATPQNNDDELVNSEDIHGADDDDEDEDE